MISSWPRVSVVVNNYNYADYLRSAIDSALAQTYAKLEVIVVDDGSTDNSQEIIAGYGSRVTSVLKSNGGQGSAFNAGFERCTGDVVIFLDADDELLPDTVELVAARFRSNPKLAKVQYRVAVTDRSGRPTGLLIPDASVSMPSGDLRQRALRFPDDIPYPPTSGNAFARWVLGHILPVPEGAYGRVGADLYLYNLSVLFGPISSLDAVGAHYRSHGANHHHAESLDLAQTRTIIERTRQTHMYMRQSAESLGMRRFAADPDDVLSVTFLAQRLISLKLDPAHHPIRGDTALRLVVRGMAASMLRVDVSWVKRAMYVAWFLAMLAAPVSSSRALAEQFFHPAARRRVPLPSRSHARSRKGAAV